MVLELKSLTGDNIATVLAAVPKSKKTLASHFGRLKRGIDGLEYQKTVRNEWN